MPKTFVHYNANILCFHSQLPVNDLTTALAMEIALFSISVFVKMAFTESTVHLVNIIMTRSEIIVKLTL